MGEKGEVRVTDVEYCTEYLLLPQFKRRKSKFHKLEGIQFDWENPIRYQNTESSSH